MIIRSISVLFVLFMFGCTPLVGAMLDKAPADGSSDVVSESVQQYCQASDPCPGGYYCLYDPCEATIGRCTKIPVSCQDTPDNPVCDCKDVTHRNECEMRLQKESKKYDGECGAGSCMRNVSGDCPPGKVCDGMCGDTQGRCVDEVIDCPIIEEPVDLSVCGCRDELFITYPDECHRIWDGAWFKKEGPCEAAECYEGSSTCGVGEFCEGPEGMCFSGMPGYCTERPMACPDNEDPVCGCDGVTYNNNCERQAAGVWLQHFYQCEPEFLTCSMDPSNGNISECPDGTFCEFFFEGNCPDAFIPVDPEPTGSDGFCVDPFNCDVPMLPCFGVRGVCGCNEVTYNDDCLRRQAGVAVKCCVPCDVCGSTDV